MASEPPGLGRGRGNRGGGRGGGAPGRGGGEGDPPGEDEGEGDPPPSGSAGDVTFTPAAPSFGPIPAGTPDVRSVLIQNSGPEAATVSLGAAAEFSLVNARQIEAGGELELFLEYVTSAAGSHSDALTAVGVTSGVELGAASISGVTIDALSASAASVSCGSATVGASKATAFYITNATGSEVSVAVGAGDFTVTPGTVPSTGVATQILVTFTPTADGAREATVTVGDDLEVALSGTGVAEAEEPLAGDDLTTVTTDGGDEAADATRYKVYVPSHETQLTMGEGPGSESSTSRAFTSVDGFGLDTDENFYVHARDGRFYARAGGDVFIQADGAGGGFAQLHQKHEDGAALLSSAGSAYVIGEGGVMINGGLDLWWDDEDDFDQKPDTAWIDGWGAAFVALDIVVGALLAKDAIASYAEDRKSTPPVKQFLEIVGAVGATAAPIVGFSSLVGAPLPGTTIFGQAGVSIFSPAFTVVYGLAGLGLVSTFPTLYGVIDSTVWAGDDVNVTGATGSVNVSAGTAINLHAHSSSGGEVTIEASTAQHQVGGAVNVLGKTIAIGSALPDAAKPQTQTIELGAGNELTITVGLAKITMSADGSIELACGTTNTLSLTPSGIEVAGTKIDLAAQKAALALDPAKAVLKFGSADVVKATPTGTTVQSGGTKLDVKAAGVTHTGTMHKLG